MAFNIGSVVAHVKADLSDFEKGVNRVKQGSIEMERGIGGVVSGIAAFGVAVGAAAVGAAVLFGKKAIDDATEYEQQIIALTTLLGDVGKAEEHIAKIKEDALKTPFDVSGLIKANQLLISAGVKADKAEKDILALGDAISANGKGAVELERIVVNLQQIKNVGAATEMDMKQFAFNGINMYQLLADSTGLNVAQLKDMNITYEMISDALAKASGEGGRYFEANLKQSESLAGLKSNLQDTVQQQLINIAMTTGLYDATKQVVAELTKWITIVGPQLATFLISAGEWLRGLSNTFSEHNGIVREVVSFFNEYLIPAVQNMASEFSRNWTWIKNIIAGTLLIITGIVQLGWSIIYGILKVGLALLSGDWDKAWASVVDTVGKAWSSAQKIFDGIITFIQGWGTQLITNLTEPFRKAWREAEEYINKIKDGLDFTKRHSPSVIDIVSFGVRKVNSILDDLNWNPEGSAPQVASGIMAGIGGGAVSINISLDGAIISDAVAAGRISEVIGDSIIRRLQANVRV